MSGLIPYQVQPNTIYAWDALTTARTMRACGFRVNTVVTSPPYFGLRSYLPPEHEDKALEIGGEETPAEYVRRLVEVFAVIRDVLTDDGTCWINIADSYAQDTKWGGTTGGKHAKGLHGGTGIGRNRHKTGLPGKNLIMIPARLALALQADGWIVRSDIIWHKSSVMPEPVTDRPTKSYEHVFLLAKSPHYYYDAEAVREPNSSAQQHEHNQKYAKRYAKFDDRAAHTGQPGNVNNAGIHSRPGKPGRNKRDVWTINPEPSPIPHFAMMPTALVEPCILAGCPKGGIVYDPFIGVGTVALVSRKHGRQFIGSELNPESVEWANAQLDGRTQEYIAMRAGKPHTQYMFAAQEQPA